MENALFDVWKFTLPYLRQDKGSTKYALEALGLLLISQMNSTLSQREGHRLVWNRTVSLRSGHNIPLELLMEFFNKLIKEVPSKAWP